MKLIRDLYQLIQEYPNSPKIGTIVSAQQHPDYMNKMLWSDRVVSYYGLNTEDILNYPKFWRKLKNK